MAAAATAGVDADDTTSAMVYMGCHDVGYQWFSAIYFVIDMSGLDLCELITRLLKV
jgi:hypothetical protein